MTCEDCKFYEKECDVHFHQELMGRKRVLKICEIFYPKEPRFIEANILVNDLVEAEANGGMSSVVARTLIRYVKRSKTVDAVEAVQFNTLKSLVNGEWVDCKLVQEALGIDFGTGLKMFDFSRTVEWNPAPLNGQKITTKFRLKNTEVHGRWNVEHEESIRCSECCFNRAHIKIPMDYCPNCGAKMDGDGNG